jgi:hypothetical protein
MSSGERTHSTDAELATDPAYAREGRDSGGRTAVSRLRDLPHNAFALAWIPALAMAIVYLVVFVVQLPHNLTALAWDSDYASAFTVPETLVKTGTDGNMVLGSAGQWVSLWFGLLTAGLPLHRALWEIAPTALFVATTLGVGWSVAQVANRRAALLAVLLGLVASPFALEFLMAPAAHNTVYPCTALLGAYLIWLARGDGRGRLTALAVPPILGVVIGACLASDLLLAATAVIPLGATAVLAGLRRNRRSRLVALSALATIVVAIPVAKLTTSIMHSLGFLSLETPEKAVALSELPGRARLLFKGLEALFNGYLTREHPGTLHLPLGLASDVVMSAALLALLAIGTVTTVRLVTSGLHRSSTRTAPQLAYSLHVVYWFASAVSACGVFWIAADTGGGTNLHESYYGTVIFSVAAVVPLALARKSRVRWLIPAGAAVLFTAALVGLSGSYLNLKPWVASSEPIVERIAAADHLTVGYGGYLDASSLTWNSDGRIEVRPVMACANPAGASICPFYLQRVPSWYVPARRDTFLLTDSEELWVNSLPSDLGKPLATYAFGTMRMYVYPYDIASRLGPEPD